MVCLFEHPALAQAYGQVWGHNPPPRIALNGPQQPETLGSHVHLLVSTSHSELLPDVMHLVVFFFLSGLGFVSLVLVLVLRSHTQQCSLLVDGA